MGIVVAYGDLNMVAVTFQQDLDVGVTEPDGVTDELACHEFDLLNASVGNVRAVHTPVPEFLGDEPPGSRNRLQVARELQHGLVAHGLLLLHALTFPVPLWDLS